jgi:hypothetical protein
MAARDIPFDLARERFFAFTSAKRPERGWKRGPYIGNAQIVRGDQILLEQTNQIALP